MTRSLGALLAAASLALASGCGTSNPVPAGDGPVSHDAPYKGEAQPPAGDGVQPTGDGAQPGGDSGPAAKCTDPTPCGGYSCNVQQGTCRTTCSQNTPCASGYNCTAGGKCVKKVPCTSNAP